MAEDKALTPAYVPFKTFTAVLDSFTSFLPDQIHPTMWPSYSGGIKSQLMGSLRFLKLVDDQDRPTDALRAIATADSQRKPALFKEAIKNAYPGLMSVDLTKATPGSFDAEMRKYGQEGDTHRKAASFFLQAAKWAGVPLSPLLLKKGSLSGSRRKRPVNGKRAEPTSKKVVLPNDPMDAMDASRLESTGVKKVIALDNDATLTLILNKNFGELPSMQRKFVNRLIDEMEDFVEEMMLADEQDLEVSS